LPDVEEPAVNLDPAAARSLKEAALLRFAADLIRGGGYNPRPADGNPGYSLSSALCTVTGCDPSARHIPDCEDLHGRAAGYLYLTGRAWSRESYLPNVIQGWEDYRPGEGWRTQAEAADVLDHAGAVLTRAGNQPADDSGREWEELRARAVTAALEVTGDSALAAECAEAVLAVCDDEARERMADQLMEATRIRSMDFRAGAAMDITAARETAALWVGAARGLLGDAENYSEMEVGLAGDPARYVFRLERCGHLTPHQARQRAEAAIGLVRAALADGHYTGDGDGLACTRCGTVVEDDGVPGSLLARAVTHLGDCRASGGAAA
jgi:hypothetical protein